MKTMPACKFDIAILTPQFARGTRPSFQGWSVLFSEFPEDKQQTMMPSSIAFRYRTFNFCLQYFWKKRAATAISQHPQPFLEDTP
jgi:hypothetical protein